MESKENVFDAIRHDDRFSNLSEILEETGIGEAMSNERQAFTFFAPTDRAFEKLPRKAYLLLTSPEGAPLAAAILGRHLIPRKYLYSDDLRKNTPFRTLNGGEMTITSDRNGLHLAEAHILLPGIAASNGIIFPVDKILRVKRSARENIV